MEWKKQQQNNTTLKKQSQNKISKFEKEEQSIQILEKKTESENGRNRREIDTSNMHVHNHSLSWFGGTTILALSDQIVPS